MASAAAKWMPMVRCLLDWSAGKTRIRSAVRSDSLVEEREFETSVSFALLLCESDRENLRLKRLPKSTIKLDI